MARGRRRFWRWPLYLVLSLVVLLGLLLVALKTSFARERIRNQVNGVLAGVFRGKIVIDRVGGLGLGGLDGVDLRVLDARGQQVVRAQGLNASASVLGLAWQLIAHSERPELSIGSVHFGHADVSLREDPDAGVSLASAFQPRTTPEPEPPSAPGAGPRLHIERITFDSVWAHGRASGSPDLDVELRRFRGSLSQSPADGFAFEVASVELVTRGLPTAADPGGNVTARVESPPDDAGPLRLELTLDGHAAGSPLALEASWVGDDAHARVLLPRLPAAFVNRQAPGLALDGDIALWAVVDGPLPQLDFDVELDATAAHVSAAGYAVVAEGQELYASVGVSRLDLAHLAENVPETELDLRLSALLFEPSDSELVGSYRLDLEPGRVNAESTPALWLTGRARRSEDGMSASGRLGADESGIVVLGDYRASLPERGQSSLGLALEAELSDPARLRPFGVAVAGMASVSAEFWPDERRVAGRAKLDLSHVEHRLIQARNVAVRAQLSGTSDDPRLKAASTLDVLSGRAHVDLDYSSQAQRLELFVADVDLLRLAHVLGTKLPLERGSLNLDATVTRAAPSTPYALDANVKADLGSLGSLDVSAKQLELPTSTPTLGRLADLRGELNANGKLDLEALSPQLTAAGVPLERTTGRLRFEVSASHQPNDPDGLELRAQVDTNGLRIVEQRQPQPKVETVAEAVANQPLAIEGIDLHLAAHTRLRSGEVLATLILRDPRGTLAELETEAELAGLSPAQLGDVQALSRVPLKAILQVPERTLASLPPLIRPAALRGRVALDAKLEGSATDPHVDVSAKLQSLRAAGSKNAVDTELDVSYARDGGKLQAQATLPRATQSVAQVSALWQGDLRRAGELGAGTSGISGSAHVKLADFPLDIVPGLLERQLTGNVSGEVALDDWGKNARLDAKLGSSSLSLAKIPVRRFEAAARTNADKLGVSFRLEVGQGYSEAALEAGFRWGRAPLPTLEHRGTARLVTRDFQLDTLNPLLTAYVSEVRGVLDADTRLVITETSTELAGNVQLKQGVLQVPSIGQRFSDITARMTVENDQFKLQELTARGTTGRLSVTGAARLDGFELRSADARLEIKNHESVPLTLEGAPIGDAWGAIEAKFVKATHGENTLDVNVAELHVVAPDSSGGTPQSLESDPDVRIGVRRADGKFVELPLQPLEATSDEPDKPAESQPLRVRVKLGNKVTVQRDRTATVTLGGQLTILVAAETTVDGRIEVRSGKLDVQGKTFEIERGVVTFEGNDPSNPTITATARWDAPGYTVYAEYLGDVKNGRIKLHSEPPLTDSEIASLLLFGSPDGSPGAGADSSNAALAVGVAGDTAAKGLNQVLDDFTNLDVSARIDTTTGSARPELVFQVSPRVSAKVTRAVGAPAVGESPDRTFLTLELRLKRAWALSALFGDRGASALDLIWRRRY